MLRQQCKGTADSGDRILVLVSEASLDDRKGCMGSQIGGEAWAKDWDFAGTFLLLALALARLHCHNLLLLVQRLPSSEGGLEFIFSEWLSLFRFPKSFSLSCLARSGWSLVVAAPPFLPPHSPMTMLATLWVLDSLAYLLPLVSPC